MNRNRRLVYDFFELSHVSRLEVLDALNLRENLDDVGPNDHDMLAKCFKRASDRGLLGKMRKEIDDRLREV